MTGRRRWLLSGASLVVFLLLWEAIPRMAPGLRNAIPPFSGVLDEVGRLAADGTLLEDMGMSTSRVLVGFLAATLVGVPIGIALGVSATFRAIFAPYLAIIRPLPSVAWIPIAMMLLGIGEQQKYLILFMGCLAPVLVATLEATVAVDATLISAARNLGAGPRQVMFRVLLPAALPQIVAGLRVALAIGWTCIISAELVAARVGLGARLWTAKDYGNMRQVVVCMAAIVLVVVVLDRIADFVVRRAMPWQRR